MRVLRLSASVLAGGYRYNLITLVRGSHALLQWTESPISIGTKGGGGRGPNRLDLTVGRFFFLLFGKMSSGWETVEIN